MKKTSVVSVILYALCAVLWIARLILDLARKSYAEAPLIFGMNALCAVLWILALIASLRRYRSEKAGEKDSPAAREP